MAGDGFRWRNNPELLQKVQQLHAEGMSSLKIARAIGMRRPQVDGIILAKGWERPTASPPWHEPEQLTQAQEPRVHWHYEAPKQVKTEVSVFLNDLHIPSHDKDAVRVALNLISYVKPKTVFLMGDIFDFYQLSRFDKNPSRLTHLQDDLNELYDFFIDLRKACGDAEIHYMEGNHEHRLTAYLWKHPESAGLDALQPEALFRLGHWGIHWHRQEETYVHHGFLVTHGSIVRKHAGYSARGEFEKYTASGISGHTHRSAAVPKTTMGGVYAWYENGCLCNLRPEYIVGVPDWQHALSIGHFVEGDDRFSIEQIQMPGHKILYRGLLFA